MLLFLALSAPMVAPPPPPQGGGGSDIDKIYLIELCHADVGFNAPPSVMQQRNHDRTVEALDIMATSPTFHWTVETGYQLEGFLDRASAFDIARFRSRLTEGRIDYGANYTNLHSGNCGEEQYHRLCYPSTRFAAQLGLPPRAAFLNDVPGFTSATPRVLAASGVEFAVLGPNASFGGRPDIPLQDRPFWWEGRDGSRVLCWITVGSYAEGFVEWGMLNLATMDNKIPGMLADFDAAGYPYDAVLVVRAFDDTFPNAGMANLAAQWNATHGPQIILSTAGEFFDYLLGKYGDVFPTYVGDASGQWEDVTTVTPASTAMVRKARAALPDLEALRAFLRMSAGFRYPFDALDEAWRWSLVFDEHSGGGVGWPGLLTQAEVEQENEEFVAIARRSEQLVAQEMEIALDLAGQAIVPSGEAGLVVFNPLGHAYDGVLEIRTTAPLPPDLRLADPAGGPDAAFRWLDATQTSLAMVVTVPARGWQRWQIQGGGTTPPTPAWTPGDRIASGAQELVMDLANGTALSWTDSATAIDWLAQPGPHRFGGIESGDNLSIFFGNSSPTNPQPVSILVEDPSPIFRRAVVFDRIGRPIREYRLYENELRVDLSVFMRESALPYVPFAQHSDHYGLTIPAALTLPTELVIDGPDGFFRPGPDSLPNAPLGHLGAGTGALLNGAAGRWLAVTSHDTPTVDLGEMVGSAQTTLETDEQTLTWKLRRHHDEGQVAGGAIVTFLTEPGLPDVTPYRFTVRVGDATQTSPSRETLRRDLAPPFYAWVDPGAGPSSSPSSQTLLDLQGAADLTCLKRSEDDQGIVLRLRAGAAGGTASVTPSFPFSTAWLANLVEEPQQQLTVTAGTVTVPLTANGVTTVLLLD